MVNCGGTSENKELLSQHLHFQRYDRSSERAKEKGDRRVCIPVPQWWPYITRQRTEYASPGAGAGKTAQGSVPRSPTYLCNAGITKWCGHQNGFQHAGTLLRRIHFGYLYPRYNASADGGCKYNGKRVNRGTVTKRQHLERKLSKCCSKALETFFVARFRTTFDG